MCWLRAIIHNKVELCILGLGLYIQALARLAVICGNPLAYSVFKTITHLHKI